MYTYFLRFSEKDRSLLKESLQVEIFFIFLENSEAEIDDISPNKLTIIGRLLTNIITTLFFLTLNRRGVPLLVFY